MVSLGWATGPERRFRIVVRVARLNFHGGQRFGVDPYFTWDEPSTRLHRGHEKYPGQEFHGDAVACLANALREELDGQIGTGYMYLASDGSVFKATWKGAFLMCWALLFPWKQMRIASRDREERRLLKELPATGRA